MCSTAEEEEREFMEMIKMKRRREDLLLWSVSDAAAGASCNVIIRAGHPTFISLPDDDDDIWYDEKKFCSSMENKQREKERS